MSLEYENAMTAFSVFGAGVRLVHILTNIDSAVGHGVLSFAPFPAVIVIERIDLFG